MRVLAQSFVLQLLLFRSGVGRLAVLVALPFHVLILLSVVRHGGRPDLDTEAVLAPSLIGMWTLGLGAAGDVVDTDRSAGVLGMVLVTPPSYFRVLAGRAAAVGVVGLVAFAESWLCAKLFFAADVTVPHPVWFTVGLLATCFAMGSTVVALSTLFVLSREVSVLMNSLTYPMYVLGGLFVPVALFPDWLEPLSRVVFLSWSADLLRAATSPAASDGQWVRLIAVVVLGLVALAAGAALTRVVLRHVRREGRVVTG